MSSAPVGILGGSFDPPHTAHLAVARLALEHFNLQKVYLIPAGAPPHKSQSVRASAENRLAMLRTAVSGEEGMEVWDGEVRRRGPSYTIDTLRQLRRHHPGAPLYFILGSDNLSEIKTWHKAPEILRNAVLCVTHRPGSSMRRPPELSAASVKHFPSPESAASSSLIRRLLCRGYSCRHLVPDGVLRHINRARLYGVGEKSDGPRSR